MEVEFIKTKKGSYYGFPGERETLCLRNDGLWNVRDAFLVDNFIRSGDTILDVGANIGLFCILFASKVRDGGKIFAFEGYPETFALLTRNIALNNKEKIIVPVLGVVASVKRKYGVNIVYNARLGIREHGSYYFKAPAKQDLYTYNSLVLDEWYSQSCPGKIDFVKIDVEGMELDVLKGCGKIIKENMPVFYVEVFERHLQRQGVTLNQIQALLSGHGYHFFRNFGNGKYKLRRLLKLSQGVKAYNLLAIHPLSARYPKSRSSFVRALSTFLFDQSAQPVQRVRDKARLRTRFRRALRQ